MIRETFIHTPRPATASSSSPPGTLFAGPIVNFTRNLVCQPDRQLHLEPCLPARLASGKPFYYE
jgi:hypothetical protein